MQNVRRVMDRLFVWCFGLLMGAVVITISALMVRSMFFIWKGFLYD